MTFSQRTTTPGDLPYYKSLNPFYISGYGMPNCACYAWGRAYEIMKTKPKLSTGNAENWYGFNDGYQRGQAPMQGAIACWAKGKPGDSSDGAGHVAVVEQINADGSIITSESGWKSSPPWWRKTRMKDGNWGQGSAYTFQGFIYLPIATVSKTESVATATGLPTLSAGSNNASVTAIQKLLGIVADGIFGQQTKAAVIAFQTAHGLDADGVVGPQTWASLLGLGVK